MDSGQSWWAVWGKDAFSITMPLVGVVLGFWLDRFSRRWGKIKAGPTELNLSVSPKGAPWAGSDGSIYLFNERDVPVGLHSFAVQFLNCRKVVCERSPLDKEIMKVKGPPYILVALKTATLEPRTWKKIEFHFSVDEKNAEAVRTASHVRLAARDTMDRRFAWPLGAVQRPVGAVI